LDFFSLKKYRQIYASKELQNFLFEPVSSTVITLRKNLARNNFIFINEFALSPDAVAWIATGLGWSWLWVASQ
jgi:hypothetical protein